MNEPYYPWDTWFDGDIHTIVRGKDFSCATPSMVAQLYTKSKTRNIKVTVKRIGDTIQVARRPVIIGHGYHQVEDFVLLNWDTLTHEAERRNRTVGAFVTDMLLDVLDVYANQKDSELEELKAS